MEIAQSKSLYYTSEQSPHITMCLPTLFRSERSASARSGTEIMEIAQSKSLFYPR